METITEHEQDRSASIRLLAWRTAINVANHRPTGGGFEMYQRYITVMYGPPELTGAPAAHSIYFSVLGEHGYIGLFLFLMVWWLTFRVAGSIRKQARDQADLAWIYHLAGMCQVTLVGYLSGGAFLSLAYFDLPYNILIVLVVAQHWLGQRAKTTRATGKGDSEILPGSPEKPDTLPRTLA
jgi:probable O-glycosylation ligase (exosortase A-associated)